MPTERLTFRWALLFHSAQRLKHLSWSEVVAAVEVAVANGFHDVVLLDTRSGLEVGDGAGNLEDAVIGTGTHVHHGDGCFTNPNCLLLEGNRKDLSLVFLLRFGEA